MILWLAHSQYYSNKIAYNRVDLCLARILVASQRYLRVISKLQSNWLRQRHMEDLSQLFQKSPMSNQTPIPQKIKRIRKPRISHRLNYIIRLQPSTWKKRQMFYHTMAMVKALERSYNITKVELLLKLVIAHLRKLHRFQWILRCLLIRGYNLRRVTRLRILCDVSTFQNVSPQKKIMSTTQWGASIPRVVATMMTWHRPFLMSRRSVRKGDL